MRKIEREPNGAGIFRPGQDLVVAGTVGKRKRDISPIPGVVCQTDPGAGR